MNRLLAGFTAFLLATLVVAAASAANAAPLRPITGVVGWWATDWERYVAWGDATHLTTLDTATGRRRSHRVPRGCTPTDDRRGAQSAAGRVLGSCGGPDDRVFDLRTGRIRKLPEGGGVVWDGGLGTRLVTGSTHHCQAAVRCTVALDLRTGQLRRFDDDRRLDVDRAGFHRLAVCEALRENVLELGFPYEARRSIGAFGPRPALRLRDCRGRTRTLSATPVAGSALNGDVVSWHTGGEPPRSDSPGPQATRPRLHQYDARRDRRRRWSLPRQGDPCGERRRSAFGLQAHTRHAVIWARSIACRSQSVRLYLGG
jgi:hypothetical protein